MKFLYLKLMLLLMPMPLTFGMNLEGMRFIYQEDVSEHCKRRVIPSVFLGSHVRDADAKMMHFSKLDVPYSCLIGVRTESGSHIILVIQLESSVNLKESCDYGDQFLVFQLSETFGGYWGFLPDSVYKHPYPSHSTYYTMSVATTASTNDVENEIDSIKTEVTEASKTAPTPEDVVETKATLVVEVPLVNISGYVVPADQPIRIDHQLDRHFDKYFDVTPRAEMSYDTKLVPLLEVSPMHTPTDPDRDDLPTQPSHYNYKTKYNTEAYGFRSTLTPWRLTTRRNYFRNKFFPKILVRNTLFPLIKRSTNTWLNTKFLTSLSTLHSEDNAHNNWDRLDLLRYNNETNNNLIQKVKSNHHENLSTIDQVNKSSKINKSILLSGRRDGFPKVERNRVTKMKDFSAFTVTTSRKHYGFTEVPFEHFLKQLNDLEAKTKSTNNNYPVDKSKSTTQEIHNTVIDLLTNLPEQKSYILLPTNEFTLTNNMTTLSINEINYLEHNATSKSEKVSVKNIEPLDTLNPENNTNSDKNRRKNKSSEIRLRKKRYIEAIQIENAIPWTQATTRNNLVVTDFMNGNEIIKNLANLLELSADEIEGRIARGNINRYMSKEAVFNICEHKDFKYRHVILMNSSRLFLLISNFYLQGMTLVLTNAETMDKSNVGCSENQLECQVSGHRVCIDSSCACDGIPNCGSYDIYDEDKLRCYSKYITNNMHLAVIAFVVLIFTLIYAIYFWLQRCVYDVSEAFFVYIAGTDNILNLNSIMKSPNDTEDASKILAAQTSYLDDMTKLNINVQAKKVRNLCSRCFLFLFCRKARETSEQDMHEHDLPTRHLYSFTQLELSKMLSKPTADAGIQTGDSLQMGGSRDSKSDESKYLIQETRKNLEDSQELKLQNVSRSQSLLNQPVKTQSTQLNKIDTTEDTTEELSQLEFNKAKSDKFEGPENKEPTSNQDVAVSAEPPVRKIRFEGHSRSSEDYGKTSGRRQRTSADYDAERNQKRIGQQQATTSKDQRWFWSKDPNKNKKAKNK